MVHVCAVVRSILNGCASEGGVVFLCLDGESKDIIHSWEICLICKGLDLLKG